jgi:hypothetical protein
VDYGKEAGKFFAGVKWLHVRSFLAIYILRLLGARRKTLLPDLQKLYIPEPRLGYTPYRAAIVSIVTSRRVSGHHIAVEYERLRHESGLCGEGTIYSTTTTTC